MLELAQRHCRPLKGAANHLDQHQASSLLEQLDSGWRIGPHGDLIERKYRFEDFAETMRFINALAWIAEREQHHPELVVGYNTCLVRLSTHDVGGLSENDFILAARIDALLAR